MGLFTNLIDQDRHSVDFSLLGTKLRLLNKTYIWQNADCDKHLILTRTKNGHCQLCTHDKHVKFLEDHGCQNVSYVSPSLYSVTLPCGHTKNVIPNANYSSYCQQCRDLLVLTRCPIGTKIQSFGNKNQRVSLLLPCGHTIKRKTYTTDIVRCEYCSEEELSRILVETGSSVNPDGTFKLRCGHSTKVVDRNRLLVYKCLGCERDKIHKRAAQYGLKPTGSYVDAHHEFILPCGHSKFIRANDIKPSEVCPICSDTHYDKPCDLYFILGFTDDFSFLKVGISNNIHDRIKEYKSTNVRAWMVASSVGFNTKREAVKVEKEFHKENLKNRLDPSLMKQYLQCGFTECYPIKIYHQNRELISKLYTEKGGSVLFRGENGNR